MIVDIPGSLIICVRRNGCKDRIVVSLQKCEEEYLLCVHYENGVETKDKFEKFEDAFDSYSSIIKTLTKGE